jgi:hypothetical protein
MGLGVPAVLAQPRDRGGGRGLFAHIDTDMDRDAMLRGNDAVASDLVDHGLERRTVVAASSSGNGQRA